MGAAGVTETAPASPQRQGGGLSRAAGVFGSMTLVSRVAGFLRDWLQAVTFGTGPAVSAFVVAYRIPNYLRRIFAEGSFASAFVPVLSELREKGDDAAVQDFIDHIAGALFATVVVVTALGWLASPWIARLFLVFASGTNSIPVELTAEMLRITFPYLTFISMTALAGGVLNSFRQFGLPAFTPVLHNLGVIVAMLTLAGVLDVPEKALAWGVCAAGLAQWMLLWPAMRRLGLRTRLRLNFRHEGVRKVFRLMLPTLFSSSVSQFNLLVGTMAASLLVGSAQSWLYYSDRLIEVPLGLFGVAIGTVILPHLAARFADQDATGYARSLDWGMRSVLLVGVPAGLGLALLAVPICATLFTYGRFTADDAAMSAVAIRCMAVGVPAFMLRKVLLAAFYARQDTRTPIVFAPAERASYLEYMRDVLAGLQAITQGLSNGEMAGVADAAREKTPMPPPAAAQADDIRARGDLPRMQAWLTTRLQAGGHDPATLAARAYADLPDCSIYRD